MGAVLVQSECLVDLLAFTLNIWFKLLSVLGALSVVPHEVISCAVGDFNLIERHDMLSEIYLIAQHTILPCCSVMLLCRTCLYSVSLVLIEILVGPKHYVLIFKGLIACTQVTHSFIDVRIHQNAQGVI